MSINFAKLLSVFSTTLTLAALLPGIATAQSSIPDSNSGTPSAPTSTGAPTRHTTVRLDKLPAAQQSAVQALQRDRIKQIVDILDENQKSKLFDSLRKRHKLSTALEDLKLSPDQQTRVDAIMSEYDDKIRSVATEQPSQSTQQATPTTTAP